jgi:hypothetical protein
MDRPDGPFAALVATIYWSVTVAALDQSDKTTRHDGSQIRANVMPQKTHAPLAITSIKPIRI